MAQLVEQFTRNEQAAGSSPASSSKKASEPVAVWGLFSCKHRLLRDRGSGLTGSAADDTLDRNLEKREAVYERFAQYLFEIISDPDYILQANKPNTAFLLKQICDADERFELILRLKVCSDPAGYKNSVITFLRIEEKKWKKYIRNKTVLYKKE